MHEPTTTPRGLLGLHGATRPLGLHGAARHRPNRALLSNGLFGLLGIGLFGLFGIGLFGLHRILRAQRLSRGAQPSRAARASSLGGAAALRAAVASFPVGLRVARLGALAISGLVDARRSCDG